MLDKWTIDNPTKWKTYLTNSGRIPSAQKQGIIPGVGPLHIAKVKYYKICISQGNSQNTTLLSTSFSTKGVLPAPLPVVATGKSTPIVENHFTAKPLAMQKLSFWTYNNCFLELLLAEFGGTPSLPLTENHSAQNSLAQLGGTRPNLTERKSAK